MVVLNELPEDAWFEVRVTIIKAYNSCNRAKLAIKTNDGVEHQACSKSQLNDLASTSFTTRSRQVEITVSGNRKDLRLLLYYKGEIELVPTDYFSFKCDSHSSLQ